MKFLGLFKYPIWAKSTPSLSWQTAYYARAKCKAKEIHSITIPRPNLLL